MLNVTVKFQNNTTLRWELHDGADVYELKQLVVLDDNSPMAGRDVKNVRIIYQGSELKDAVRLVEDGVYYPILRLLSASSPPASPQSPSSPQSS